MKLTKSQVQHISDLARLNLSDEEVENFRRQLSSILEYVELLNEVDTSQVEPTAQTTGLRNVYREDKPQEGEYLSQEQVLINAADKEDGFILTLEGLPLVRGNPY